MMATSSNNPMGNAWHVLTNVPPATPLESVQHVPQVIISAMMEAYPPINAKHVKPPAQPAQNKKINALPVR